MTLCSVCGINPAGTERWQIVDGKMKITYLCRDCERKEQEEKADGTLRP